jgi:ABC-2 type transport system permease protein
MDRLYNIFWLETKELRSLLRDTVIVVMLIYSFTFSVYTRATGISSDVHNASVGLVDEDRSPSPDRSLRRSIRPISRLCSASRPTPSIRVWTRDDSCSC